MQARRLTTEEEKIELIENFCSRVAGIMHESIEPHAVLEDIVEQVLSNAIVYYGPGFPLKELEEEMNFRTIQQKEDMAGNC